MIGLDSVDSTNEEARRRAGIGAPSGTVIWARRQEHGRGRRGRRWESPDGNLYCSVILCPDCDPAVVAQISLVAAVALGETVAHCLTGDLQPSLKWPNDVLVRGRKIAGILLESEPTADRGIARVVLGVGLNLRHFPADCEYPATSLVNEGVAEPDVAGTLKLFLARLGVWYARWQRLGLAPVREAWLTRAVGLGLPITVRLHRESFVGCFAGLDNDGSLLLDPEDGGAQRRVTAGDVFFPWLTGPSGFSAGA
ncbi:MAG: biotin--[acetyl-CoA-carboxylase] ligase [Rhodospirillaceae bacterium]